MTINTSSLGDRILPACQFMTCTEEDLTMILESAMELLSDFQRDTVLDLSVLKTQLTSKTRTELPEYTKLVGGDDILGWYHLIHRTNTLELDDVNIREPYRNQGLGRMILDQVKQEADFLNTPVNATVQKDNLRGIHFYQRHGFVLIEDAKDKYFTLLYQPFLSTQNSVT